MTTMVSFSVRSAYGRESVRFDPTRSGAGVIGLGKLLVAFDTIRNVDAGASIFLGSGLNVLEVWSRGPMRKSEEEMFFIECVDRTYISEEAGTGHMKLE
jgi:hypothetical protein